MLLLSPVITLNHTNPFDHMAASQTTSLAHSPSRPQLVVFPFQFRENGWRQSAPDRFASLTAARRDGLIGGGL
jgi:hypothetical protein